MHPEYTEGSDQAGTTTTSSLVPYNPNGHVVSEDALTALREKFRKSEVKKRPGPGGKTFSYIPWAKVAQRLNKAFGETGWTFTYLMAPKMQGEEVVVGVRLQCPLGVFDAYASKKHFSNNPNANYGDTIQGATSIALRRAAARMGVGLELYMDEKAEAEVELTPEVTEAQAALKSAMRTMHYTQTDAIEMLRERYGYSKSLKNMGEMVMWVMKLHKIDEVSAIWHIIRELQGLFDSD